MAKKKSKLDDYVVGRAPVQVAQEWRTVHDFPLYEVSSDGQVRSFHKSSEGSLLRQTQNKRSGHMAVTLVNGKQKRCRFVHRLMAEAFLGEPPTDKHEVRHIDGDPANNVVTNLAWGTHRDNMLDKVDHGTHNNARKTECANGHAYTPENTRLYRRKGAKNASRLCIACEYNRRHGLNQHADTFKDRRTKRNRDRSTQNRTAIEKSKDDE